MKFFKRLLFAVLLLVALDFGYDHAHDAAQALRNYQHRNEPVTMAQKSAHMIVFYDAKEKPESQCSGTAVSPHILLTAAHCNDNSKEHYTTISLDYSEKKFHILAELPDKSDHVLYLLDGTAFTNYIPMIDVLRTYSAPDANADVVVFGDGEAVYPPRPLYGYIDSEADAADFSDVDKADGIHYYVLAVQHGDSGSAVYDLKTGQILGVLTYGLDEHDTDTADHAVSFALQFPADAEAQLAKLALKPKPAPKKQDEKNIPVEDFAKTLKH